MKLTKRIYLWAAAILVAVMLGCLSGTAAGSLMSPQGASRTPAPPPDAPSAVTADEAGADYAVAPGGSFIYVDKSERAWTVRNPSIDHALVAHYYAEDDRYAFGEYILHSTDREWVYGEEGALNEENWTSRVIGYTEDFNYHADYDANAKTEKNTPAGTYINDATVTVSFAGDSDGKYRAFDESSFLIRTSWGTVTIHPATLTLTGGDMDLVYDGMPHRADVAASTVDGSAVTVRFGTSADTCSAEEIAYTGAGSYTVYYRMSAPNHEDACGSLTMQIRPRDLADAEIFLLSDKLMYNAAEQTVVIERVEVGELTLVPGTDYMVISGDRATHVSKDGYTLTLRGTGNFTGTAERAWEITRYTANRITDFSAEGWTYNDPTHPTPTATAIFGTPTFSYSDDGVHYGPLPENPHAGRWKVMASVEGTDDYVGTKQIISFVVEKDLWEGDMPAATYERPIYSGEAQTLRPSFVGGPPEAPLSTSGGATAVITHVSDRHTVLATLVYENYLDLTVSWTAEIAPCPVTIRTDDGTKVYDGTPLVSAGYTPISGAIFPGDDILGGSATYATLTYILPGNVNGEGKGTLSNTVTFAGNSDYIVTVETGTLTIAPAPLTIRIDDTSNDTHVYNGRMQAYLPTYIGKPVGFVGRDLGAIDITAIDVQGRDVGAYPISGALSLYANNQESGLDVSLCYDLQVEGEAMLIIAPLPIVLTAKDHTVTYGDERPAWSYAAETLVEGESLVGVEPTCSYEPGSSVGHYEIGFADMDAIRAANCNYAITFVPGCLRVEPKAVTIPVNDATTTYGAAAPAFTVDMAGRLVGSDTLTGVLFACSYDTDDAARRGPGTYAVTATVPDGVNPNYAITFVPGTLTVQKKTIVLTIADATVVYRGPAPTLAVVPPEAGVLAFADTVDSLAIRFVSAYLPGDDVGTCAISAVCEDERYLVLFVDGTLSITPLALNDADMVAVFAASVYSGVAQSPLLESLTIEGETVAPEQVRYTATAVDAGTYEVLLTVVGGNWQGSTGTVSWRLSPFPIREVEWIGQSFAYNGEDQGPTAVAYGPTGERLLISSTTARFVGEWEAAAVAILPDASYKADNYALVKVGMDTGLFCITEATPVRIRSAGVTIGDAYGLRFKVPVEAYAQYGVQADAATLTLTVDGKTVVLRPEEQLFSTTDIDSGTEVLYYVFAYREIAPHEMGNAVMVTLSVGQSHHTRTYSVAQYCYDQLERNGEDTRFCTVLVALLRYGAAAERYVDPTRAPETFVTHRLTTDPTLAVHNAYVTATPGGYADCNRGGINPAGPVIAHAVGMTLGSGVRVTYYIDLGGAFGTPVVTVNGRTYTDLPRESDGRYALRLAVPLTDCRVPLDMDVYVNGIHAAYADFSPEGYAANRPDTPARELVDLCTVLVDYMNP